MSDIGIFPEVVTAISELNPLLRNSRKDVIDLIYDPLKKLYKSAKAAALTIEI